MAHTPTGTTFFLYTSLQTAKAVTVASNAAEAVLTIPAHGYSVGDVLYVESGWGRLHKRAFVVKAVAGDNVTLTSADTTNTDLFPAGGGTGSTRKALTPVQVTQILQSNTSGGEAKTIKYRYMENESEYSISDGFNATERTFQVDADAFGSPGYTLMRTLTATGADTVLKTVLKGGSYTLQAGTMALNEEIQFQDGQVNRVNAAFSASGQTIRY